MSQPHSAENRGTERKRWYSSVKLTSKNNVCGGCDPGTFLPWGFPASQPCPCPWGLQSWMGSACPLGVLGASCCRTNTHPLETLCSVRQQSACSPFTVRATRAGILLHKVWQNDYLCVSAAACCVPRLTRIICLKWGLNVGLRGVWPVCGELSERTAQQNKPHSGFRTELSWLDSRRPSVKITLVRISLCVARACGSRWRGVVHFSRWACNVVVKATDTSTERRGWRLTLLSCHF